MGRDLPLECDNCDGYLDWGDFGGYPEAEPTCTCPNSESLDAGKAFIMDSDATPETMLAVIDYEITRVQGFLKELQDSADELDQEHTVLVQLREIVLHLEDVGAPE